MNYPLIINGLCMDYAIHGLSMDTDTHTPAPMDNPWIINGLSLDYPWIIEEQKNHKD